LEYAVLDSSEIYDPSERSFHETGKMTSPRSQAAATRLPDERVLITGGFDQSRAGLGLTPRVPTSKAEVFDPKTNLFTPAGSMRNGRYRHSSVLLENGKALITGGSCQAEIGTGWGGACGPEWYDPDKGTFSSADPSGAAHNEETAIVLTNGRVLFACAGTAAELYDPKSGQFNRTGDMLERMDLCGGIPLKDGRVLVMGATNLASTTHEVATWRAQIYDPEPQTFSWLDNPPSTLAIRYLHPSMTVGF
jgi:Kelch motif